MVDVRLDEFDFVKTTLAESARKNPWTLARVRPPDFGELWRAKSGDRTGD